MILQQYLLKNLINSNSSCLLDQTNKKGKQMINKLRLSTAIIGSLAGLGLSAAVAQTTVSGNIAVGFIASSTDATTKSGSWSSMSKETQINIGTKGKLNNGMGYAAGFSIENDGPDTGAVGTHTEGNYIEISSGDTTLTLGADRIQNGDRHVTNANGIGYIGQDGLGAGAATTSAGSVSIFPRHGAIYQNFGAGIVQKVGNGNLSFLYVPKLSTTTLNEIGNDAGAVAANDDSTNRKGDAFEVGYIGDLGVAGLTLQAFYTTGDRVNEVTLTDKKVKSTNLGASYKMGNVTLSASQLKTEGVQAGQLGSATLTEELTGKSIGVAFAASKDLTLGLTYGKADSTAAAAIRDEKTIIASVGYSLGAVGVKAQVADVENFSGQANNDGKMARVLVFTSF
jgi:hypothetical protein